MGSGMGNRLVELMRDTIHDDYELQRQGREWVLRETGTGKSDKSIKLRAADRHTFAFTLDRQGKGEPLAFFSGSPPRHIKKMCDAIMACHYRQRCYLFLIEWKTANTGEYRKQSRNGRLFCDWLLRLYEEHGHTHETPVFVSLLISSPRPSVDDKGTTGHEASTADWDKPSADLKKKGFDHAGKIRNQSQIRMGELLNELKELDKKELRKTARGNNHGQEEDT